LHITLKHEVGQSGFTNNIDGQSEIQDNQAVEAHNLQSSEGQLRKPSFLFGVDVIDTSSLGDKSENTRSDDLLALQALGNQLEHSLVGTGETVSSLNLDPEILVSESKTLTNCLLVRAETPTSSFRERRREMADIEHFLSKDWRFSSFVQGLRRTNPGRERNKCLMSDPGKPAIMSPCMMKIVRMNKDCVKILIESVENGVHAISIPNSDGYTVPWFHMTWVSAEEPRAQATLLMVGALHWSQIP
jgi:hypothetical protein